MATMELDEPGAYGRVIRDSDGSVLRVVEAKGGAGDATAEELEIREVNTGVYAFDGGALVAALATLDTDNAQGELYLPDVLPAHPRRRPRPSPRTRSATPTSRTASTTASTSPYARQVAQRRIHEDHMRAASRSSTPARPRSTPTSTIGTRHRRSSRSRSSSAHDDRRAHARSAR